MAITTIVEASEIVSHGRPRDVLAMIERFLRWQDEAILALAVEIDGVVYLPPWIFDA